MELKQLETFRMVATLGSFTGAAAALGYAQSSVTAQIQSLEREVGAPLFDRMSRRTVLTAAGERLLLQAQQMLAIAAEAVSRTPSEEALSGEIHVVTSDSLLTYLLHPPFSAFRKSHPQVHLRLRSACTTSEVRRQLVEGYVDVAFVYEETTREAAGICVEDMGVLPVAVACAPDHALARKASVKPADLAGESLLLTLLGCCYRNLFERALLRAGVPYEVHLELDNVEPIKRCAAAGMGVIALPEAVMERELREGSLVKLPWAGPPMSVHALMMWHKNRSASRALTAFTEQMRSQIARWNTPNSPKRPPRKPGRTLSLTK